MAEQQDLLQLPTPPKSTDSRIHQHEDQPAADRTRPPSPSQIGLLTARWKEEVGRFATLLGLTDVHLRCDDEARAVTEAEGARGVAFGDTVYLNPDRIRPGTSLGDQVLVHELVHIAQARLPIEKDVGRAMAEAEAVEIARSVANGGTASPTRAIDLSRAAADTGATAAKTDSVTLGIEDGLARAAAAAETTFERLVTTPADRETIIAGLLASLPDLVTTSELLFAANCSEGSLDVSDKVQSLSESIAKISRWVDGRPANAALVTTMLPVIRQVNRVRKLTGLGLLGAMPTPAIPLKVTEEEADERNKYDAHLLDLLGKLDKKFDALAVGADEFAARVKLTQSPDPTPLWAEIVKSLVIAVVGNLLGPVGRIVVGLGERTGEMIEAMTSDWVQAAAGDIASTAVAQTEADERRDEAVFVTGLKLGQLEVKDKVRTGFLERKLRGTLPDAEIRRMTGELEKDTLGILAHEAYLEAAHAYAKLNAHRSLGVETDLPTGVTVSAMDSYLGLTNDDNGRRLRADQRGARGVASLDVKLEVPEDGVCEMEIQSFNIHGLNKDMAQAALERARSHIERLDLPMEIHFIGPGVAPKDEAYMVVDEIGRIRDTSGWDLIEQYLPLLRGRSVQNPDPEKVLAILRTEMIPEKAAV